MSLNGQKIAGKIPRTFEKYCSSDLVKLQKIIAVEGFILKNLQK